ncbi:4'-phosphopantetheinyl transferase superfamily protein [Streptomyces sp. BHT-5-2]|uniref:holo-ACP synthase n=1 Tax=Streptomyces sp. BHT-5-2 TaxID=2866715 RepID=UPI001C8D07EA|nr:4'-phosphopantetheinyl transferase superfamily protein [Streptomyces sp. BHT-5-2]QZL06398.1 4'-phosphopantetheinyl transferase superfamily protein [Streptomyces sp. BHT-5-2]
MPGSRPAEARVVGIGVDIVDLTRMARFLHRYPDRSLRMILGGAELAQVRCSPSPAVRLGISFGTKEACGKALGTGLAGLAWTDIEAGVESVIAGDADGEVGDDGWAVREVGVALHGAARNRAARLGIERWAARAWPLRPGALMVCAFATTGSAAGTTN